MAVAKKLDGSETGFVKALSVLNEAGGDIAEEKLEIIFGGIDFSHLLKQHGAAGTVARIINAVHPDARLVALSTLAAYIDHRRDINPALKFVLVAALRAAPQALTAMLAAKQPIDEKTLANALEVKVKQVEGRELYVGSKRTDLIHDYAFHPAAKDDVVNRGSLVDILQRFDRNLLCPDCFREEINRGRVVIETKVEPHKAGRAFRALAGFRNASKREFFDAIEILATLEVNIDHGLGLEGEASHILAAHTLGLGSDPIGLEDIIPDDVVAADRMIELSELSAEEVEQEKRVTGRVLLPLSARRYIHALLAAYRVDHPASNMEVRATDWKDRFWSWAPEGIKPKKRGWAGVREVATKPLGLIFLGLVGILLVLLVIAALLVIAPTLYLVGVILSGLFEVPEIFRPYMSLKMMTVQKGLTAAWILLVVLPVLGQISPRFEPYRARLQTLRIVVAAAGFGLSLAGFGTDWFTHTGMALFITAVWTVLLAVEFSNKFGVKMTPAFVTKGMERFVTATTAVGVALLLIGVAYFVTIRHEDAERVTALSTGVANSVIDEVAEVASVSLPPSRESCRKGLAQLMSDAKELKMTVARICELANNEFPCDCR